jgi:hypothetical protein
MLIATVLSFCLGSSILQYNITVLDKKDDRMNVTEEMLGIIKDIKTNTLEKYFYARINRER